MKKSIGSGRGSVYNIILKALQSGDKYGYEICKEVEEKTNGAYILKQPSLYSGLKRLEAQGEVKSYWRDSLLGGRRHYYTLTENGRTRIENSNFNWLDARDEIVDGLFEKSELEKTIESVESDIDQIKSTSLFDENIIQNAKEVIDSTENLVNENEDEHSDEQEENLNDYVSNHDEENVEQDDAEEEVKYFDSSSNDLFSMFSTVAQNEESVQEVEETENKMDDVVVNFEEKESDVEEETKFEEIDELLEEKKFQDQEQSQDNNEQIDLFSFVQQKEAKEDETLNKESQNIKSRFVDNSASQNNEDENQYVDNNWQDIENNLKTTKQDEISKDSNNIFDQEENEKEVILEKNSQDAIEEYKMSNFAFNSYIDNTQTAETESFFSENDSSSLPQNESLFETNFELDEEIQPNQDDKIENNIQNIEEKEDFSQTDTNKENNEDFVSQNKQKDEEVETNQTSVDYRDIFGDLISSGNSNVELDDGTIYSVSQNTEEEIKNQYNTNGEKFSNFGVESVDNYENRNNETQQTSKLNDLPRNEDSLKDINRTLMFDAKKEEKYSNSNFESYDQTPFKETNAFESTSGNPFEKYDTYQKIEENVKQNKSQELQSNLNSYEKKADKMSFDKKYANAYNNFEVPDYEVRYFRKNNVENKISKFISINKLNLVKSFILSILICLMTTVLLIVVATKVQVGGFQMFMFIFSYLIAFGTLLYNFLKYASNKNKKIQKLPRHESMYSTFIAIVIVILSLAINLFMGMSFNNIIAYFGSLILPIFFAIIIILDYPLKKFLSKFASFYN